MGCCEGGQAWGEEAQGPSTALGMTVLLHRMTVPVMTKLNSIGDGEQ